MENNDNIKKEVQKQLMGINIIIVLDIAFYAIIYIAGMTTILSDFKSYGIDIILIFWVDTIFFGGVLALLATTLVGLNKGYHYSLITARIILIFLCFSIVGLILVLTIFWKRLNLPIVKQYLHYNS